MESSLTLDAPGLKWSITLRLRCWLRLSVQLVNVWGIPIIGLSDANACHAPGEMEIFFLQVDKWVVIPGLNPIMKTCLLDEWVWLARKSPAR